VTYNIDEFNPYQVVIADVNRDGKPDLVVASEGSGWWGPVSVLLGNGDGTFQPAVAYYSGGSWPTSVAVADINGDGKPDLIVADSYSSSVGVLLGNGDGTFQSAVSYPCGPSPYSVVVADVNADGNPDVIVANGGWNFVNVLLGNGDGTFRAPVAYSSGGDSPWYLAVADVNGDSRPDIVVVNGGSNSVGVLLGNGDGTFQAPVTYPTGGTGSAGLAVADVNGDGKPDAVVGLGGFCQCCECVNQGGVSLLLSGTGPRSATTTSVASSADPANPGQTVTYTAVVTTETGGAATGTVTIMDGSITAAVLGLVNNQAAWSTSYAKKGIHAMMAQYPGDADNTGSTSDTLTEHIAVLPVASKTRVATSGSPSQLGQPVTFTATVTSSYGQIPDGELVTFYNVTKVLGSVALTNETAAYTTSSLAVGKHTIKAVYPGDKAFKPSKGVVIQVVEK
jgi:hypothetical protein